MVGVDTQVVHGFVNCGATGAITGIGNVLPREVLHLVSLCERAAKGDAAARRQAVELEQALAVLSSFDEGADLVLYYKYLMTLRGGAEYALHFNESDALSASQAQYAKAQLELFEAWYADWSRELRTARPRRPDPRCASSIPTPRASRRGSSSSGGPDLGCGPLAERRRMLRRALRRLPHLRAQRAARLRRDGRRAAVRAGRSHDCDAGLIFFNNAGYLGMCGHATIGAAVTLAHMGRLAPAGSASKRRSGS